MPNKIDPAKASKSKNQIVKPLYFSNWGDIVGYPIANRLLPYATRFVFLTPNVITVLSFLSYVVASIFLIWSIPFHLVISGILFFVGFVLDDLDGQVARTRRMSSPVGDYLDKTLDVLKIFILTVSLGWAVYLDTQNAMYIVLAFMVCFFFMYRYYIKLETVFGQVNLIPNYLEKSQQTREKLSNDYDEMHLSLQKTLKGRLISAWHTHKLIFFVDEAEFAILTAIGALANKLAWTLVVLAVSQIVIAGLRFFQRMIQVRSKTNELLMPLRK